MIEAPTYGWLATRTVVGLVLALVLVGVFILWELRQSHPLLDPRMFRQRPLATGSMSIFVQFFAFFGFTFIGLQYLQLVRGDTPLLAAVQVLPVAATMVPDLPARPRAHCPLRHPHRVLPRPGLGGCRYGDHRPSRHRNPVSARGGRAASCSESGWEPP